MKRLSLKVMGWVGTLSVVEQRRNWTIKLFTELWFIRKKNINLCLLKDLLTQIKPLIAEELFTKGLKTITTEEKHEQAIIKFTIKMSSAKVSWSLSLKKVFVYLQVNAITLLKYNSNHSQDICG
jgi:hypothetical protein